MGFKLPSVISPSNFTQLQDVPASYTGEGSKVVAVKADETGLEFINAGSGSGDVVGPASSTFRAIATYADATGKLLLDNNTAIIDGDGNISAANLSGTNTGDQVITLTGDVSGSGTGSFDVTITNTSLLTRGKAIALSQAVAIL